jgi:NDP-sugar pyrophosphorylase family protein
MNKEVFDYIEDDNEYILKLDPLKNFVKNKQLAVYSFEGYWAAIDINKDLIYANETWKGVE